MLENPLPFSAVFFIDAIDQLTYKMCLSTKLENSPHLCSLSLPCHRGTYQHDIPLGFSTGCTSTGSVFAAIQFDAAQSFQSLSRSCQRLDFGTINIYHPELRQTSCSQKSRSARKDNSLIMVNPLCQDRSTDMNGLKTVHKAYGQTD